MQNSSNTLPTVVVEFSGNLKIAGESLLKGFEGQVDAWHVQHGLSMPMVADKSSNSRTSGRARHEDFTFWLPLSKAYPKLLEACAKGTNLGSVVVRTVKMSEGKMLIVAEFKLSQSYVSNVSILNLSDTPLKDAAPAAGGGAVVRFSLNYQDLDCTYNEYDASGSSKGAVSSQKITGI
jgi:type VI secretion system Hcp family effector